MRPTEKRKIILVNGVWIFPLTMVGVILLIIGLGHLPAFWLGFVGSFIFGSFCMYLWYLEYRSQLQVYAKRVTLIQCCIIIELAILFPICFMLLLTSPETIEMVIPGLITGFFASMITGIFGVALFYYQPTKESPTIYNPYRKEWSLPLDALPLSSPPPFSFSQRPADGIQRFPFHFVGYDLFFDVPYRTKHVRCRVCDTLCEVRRNVYGALNWKDYNREFYQWHDSFACPHTTTAWHNRALKLVQQIEQTEQADFRQPLVEDLRVLLKESKHMRW